MRQQQFKYFGSVLVFFMLFQVLVVAQTRNDIEFDSLQYLIQQHQISGDSLSLSRVLYSLGKYFDKKGELDNSNTALRKSLLLAIPLKNNKGIATIGNYLACNLSIQGESDSALKYYKLALNAAIKVDEINRTSGILINLADEYAQLGEFEKAVEYCLRAVKLKEEKADSTNIVYYYQKLGESFKASGQISKWKKYVNKGYRLINVEDFASIQAMAAIYNDLGGIAEKEDRFDDALCYYDTLEMLSNKNEYNRGIAVANANRAIVLKKQNRISEALAAAKRAYQLESNKYTYQNIFNLNLLAELYLANNQPLSANKYIKELQQIEALSVYPNERMRYYKIKSDYEQALGNYLGALFWKDKHYELKDSLRNDEVGRNIANMEITYETEKKENQIKLLTASNQIKKQRNILWISVSVILLLILIVGIMFYLKHKKQNAQRQEDLKQQLLRSQMNPHFLFNALGSIQNFMLKNETQKAAGYLNNFASLTRNILEHSAREFVSVSDEIETLRNYMELEKMRLNNSFEFKISYDKELEMDFINIPPMLIQPFIENAIKHGLNDLDYKGLLELKFEEKESVLHIEIADNGVGIDHTKENKSKLHRSMSMNIFEQRRIVLAKRTKRAIWLEVCDRSNLITSTTGTLVKIEIPILN